MLCHVDWCIITDVSKEFISFTLSAKLLYSGLLEPADEGNAIFYATIRLFLSVKM